LKVLNHTSVAMEQDKRWSRSPLNVMEPNPLDCDEASRWEGTTLGSFRKNVIHNEAAATTPTAARYRLGDAAKKSRLQGAKSGKYTGQCYGLVHDRPTFKRCCTAV
jgi:hypothetical protein